MFHQHYVIGVCGASCSGKTTACHQIEARIKSILGEKGGVIAVLSQDRYYKGGDYNTNFDIPESLDFDMMATDLSKLKNGKPIDAPVYDFSTHKRKENTEKNNKSRLYMSKSLHKLLMATI